jgi:ribonuclease Z
MLDRAAKGWMLEDWVFLYLGNSCTMLDNAPLITHTHKSLTIEGYSRAAVQSYWRIPELRLGFDLGAHPWDFMGTSTIAITHTHLDHIAALPVYVARRRMMKMEPPTIYLPASAIDGVEALLRVVSRLDRGRLPCELIPVEPGQEIELSRELVMTVHRTTHTVPSVGYLVWERRKKLKQEYLSLSGPEIRDLKNTGTEITTETRIPIVGYTGDTSPPGLDDNPDLYRAQVLITEMTFVAPKHRKEKIHKHGHMHLDDWVARQEKFRNELVIAAHFSVRYNAGQVEKAVRKKIPDMLQGRLRLWL